MRQGADRAPWRERRDDLYETPECAIRTLMRVEPLPEMIWEPCAGRGAISRWLRRAGHKVVAYDLVAHPGADDGIQTPIDFLMERRAPVDARLIVTNPPFKNADAFVRHGLELGCDVIVLQRLMAIEGANRSDLIDRHLVRVWAGRERLPQMHRDEWTGKHAVNSIPFAWFVFSPHEHAPGLGFQVIRMSWRGA